MKALTWHGKHDIRCDTVPDPKIQDSRDAIIKVTACAICGSDLHIYDGVIPSMEKATCSATKPWARWSRSVATSASSRSATGSSCRSRSPAANASSASDGFYSGCERIQSRPTKKAEKLWGHSPAGLFGYSHMLGGYAGGQAEYLRVPYADVGPIKVPDGSQRRAGLFLSDIFPTGYMAADFCNIKAGDTVAVWGCGPVGQFAIRSAFLLGAERVIAIDTVPERLALARAGRRARRSISRRRMSTSASRN